MIDRFSVVPAAHVVFRRDGDLGEQVLLQLRRGTGYMDEHWACAAARHVESGESVLETARREVVEELGVKVELADLKPLCAMHRTEGSRWIDQRVDSCFECRRDPGRPLRALRDRPAL